MVENEKQFKEASPEVKKAIEENFAMADKGESVTGAHNMAKQFDSIIEQTETINNPTKLDESLQESEKEKRWKKEREQRITSSKMPNFMKSGTKKGETFGKTAIKEILKAKGEARTGETFEEDLDIFNFFGGAKTNLRPWS